MFKKVIAFGLLPLLVACNSSNSDKQETVLPGEPGMDIESPGNGNDGADCNSGNWEWCDPSTDHDSEEDLTPSKNPMYLAVAEHFHTRYEFVHDVCESEYSENLPIEVKYNLTCDWVDESFVVTYTEFSNENHLRGGYSTIMLTINNDYLNRQSLGFNAFLYSPAPPAMTEVKNFSFDISEHPFDWDQAKVNPFEFHAIASSHDLLIKTNQPGSSIYLSDFIGSDSKRFRLYSDIEIESGNASIYDNIANYQLFYLVYRAFRAS